MNKEYRKFNELADVYIPPATDPEHFSNLPDVLIPSGYQEPEGDPLEKDVADLIKETKTPPPTPPEEEPGRAGCNIFREKTHYVAPIYQDEDYQRIFTTKLILLNLATYGPTMVLMIIVASLNSIDYAIISNPKAVTIPFILGIFGVVIYVYFVGLFRNPPMLYICIGFRVILNTTLFTGGMLLVHMAFLFIIDHPENENAEHHHVVATGEVDSTTLDRKALDHAPPFMAILIVCLMIAVQGTFAVLLMKYKIPVFDYRMPFVIYTMCFSISALLVTIALNGGFHNEPVAYDLFQVISSSYISSILLMRTPHFIERLYSGKVCPLREGELLYALIQYGL